MTNASPNGRNGRAARHDRATGAAELTVFLHLSATPGWLALSRRQQDAVVAEEVTPLLHSRPEVSVRWFEAEAWSARPTHILTATTLEPRAWTELFEQLRGTSLWTAPYFEVALIVPGVEQPFPQRTARPDSAYSGRHGSGRHGSAAGTADGTNAGTDAGTDAGQADPAA